MPTGWWTRVRPTAFEFGLSPDELDERNASRMEQSGAEFVLASAILLLLTSLEIDFEWLDTTHHALFGLAVALTALVYYVGRIAYFWARARVFLSAEATRKRVAFTSALEEFDQKVLPWRQAQAEVGFWEKLGDTHLEQFLADLLMGILPGANASLTRGSGDRFADVVACHDGKAIIAQCKGQDVGLIEVRQLAGAKLLFQADAAIFAARSIKRTSQVKEYASRCGLILWDKEDLAAIATKLLSGEKQPIKYSAIEVVTP